MNRTEPESYQDFETLPARLIGAVWSPRALFASAIERPRWVAIMLLTFLVTAGARTAFMQTAVGRQALVDQWERTTLAFGGDVSDERYQRFISLSERGATYAVATALAGGPALTFVLAGSIYGVFGRLRASHAGAADLHQESKASYTQVLAVVANAGVILALRQLVATPLNYSRETLANPATLGLLIPVFDEASPPARFLGAIDLFVVWWVIVLGIGVAVLYRRPARSTVAALMGAYVGLAALLAIAMIVIGGTV